MSWKNKIPKAKYLDDLDRPNVNLTHIFGATGGEEIHGHKRERVGGGGQGGGVGGCS